MHLGRGYRCGRWYFAWRQLKTCFAVKVDYSCLSLLALLDLLHWVGTSKRFEWDFLFYLPETNKQKKPFGNGAICYYLGSLFIRWLASG